MVRKFNLAIKAHNGGVTNANVRVHVFSEQDFLNSTWSTHWCFRIWCGSSCGWQMVISRRLGWSIGH